MKYPIVVTLLSFLALYLLSKAQASHFRHAILTWAPVNSHSNTLILRFRMAFRRSFSSSYNCDQSIINSGALRGSGRSWIARCRNSYCSSRTIADTGFQCTDFSVDEDWTMGEKNFTYTFPSVSKEWVVSYQGCCWISSLVKYPNGYWLVKTTINLTRRSDTGRINSSPVSKSPAIIRFKEGCPQSFRIPVEDPDDDVVKCRWATYSESFRHNDSFPHGVIDERACLLQYNGQNGTAGTYAVALTLEDFTVGTTDFNSATPFSAVGLQFLVIISERSGSCADVPLFTKATPTDGECTELQIGLAYRAVIEVKLQDPSRR
ncbi:PREDICTED: integrin beta-like protein A isoform X1 [Acropora digitifera]|uniref:integrin beta-like protein A isoform X1 n=1 Tax=Acropora digitifera TaxID=70779 RepID=UPI00077A2B8F|nr:PREDICTED: integrin beta-like protein A isoform X1 [Acropora digitifera]